MRRIVALVAMVSLASCDSPAQQPLPSSDAASEAAPATEPTPRTSANAGRSQVQPRKEVVLSVDSISVGDTRYAYGAEQRGVEAALEGILGPADRMDMEDCGDGSMSITTFEGGFGANFSEGKLVGWFWRDPMDDENPPKVKISTDTFLSLGTTRAQVEKLKGYEFFADSTLGEEFYLEGKPSGFFDRGKVTTLFDGMQCFFR